MTDQTCWKYSKEAACRVQTFSDPELSNPGHTHTDRLHVLNLQGLSPVQTFAVVPLLIIHIGQQRAVHPLPEIRIAVGLSN